MDRYKDPCEFVFGDGFLLGVEGFPADSVVKEQNDGTAKLLFVL